MTSSPTTSSSSSALALALAEQRRRQRERARRALRDLPPADFIGRSKIEVPVGDVETTLQPFDLWPAQREVLDELVRERLVVFLKARQLGISWLVCGFVHRACTLYDGQPWLLLSRGQLEANELTRRIQLLHREHADASVLPRLAKDNLSETAWENGSRAVSLAATKDAGRSFTAAGVVLDEWAFMTWGREVLASVKPTIDAGGKLIIISSADGIGTDYHRFWQSARGGTSGYKAIFLPWTARPGRGPDWRDAKLLEANGDLASVKREYPENDDEAFIAAEGLVYEGQWADGTAGGNVTEAADYDPEAGGDLIWAVDDGYAGKLDRDTQMYTADSHPRVILFVQEKPDGHLDIFDESYAVETLSEDQIADALARSYPAPDWAVVDKSAAELKGRLHDGGIPTRNGPGSVAESVKELRRALAKDANGWRRLRVHPRCVQLRREMAAYRAGPDGTPVKAFDHGPDCARYLAWVKRHV